MQLCSSLSILCIAFLWDWFENWPFPTMTAAKSLQSCPTLCDPIDGSLPGSPVSGILQSRTLEWVAISFSKEWKGKVKVKSLSRVRLLATPQTAAYQAPPSTGFSRQEYWSGVPLPSPPTMISASQTLYSGISYLRILLNCRFWFTGSKCAFLTSLECCCFCSAHGSKESPGTF